MLFREKEILFRENEMLFQYKKVVQGQPETTCQALVTLTFDLLNETFRWFFTYQEEQMCLVVLKFINNHGSSGPDKSQTHSSTQYTEVTEGSTKMVRIFYGCFRISWIFFFF